MPARANSDIATRTTQPLIAAILAALLLLVAVPAAPAGFAVASIHPRAAGKILHVSGNFDLSLTSKVEEAIGKGIPLELVFDLRLYRERTLIWDERVSDWNMRRELSFHALSGQYLIGGIDTAPTGDRESFIGLNEALDELGSLDDVTFPLKAPLRADATYRLDVRVALDIEALPSLLRPVAYTSSDWDLNSGWTTWKVQH